MAKLNITINDKFAEALEKVSSTTGLRKSELIERTILKSLEDVELAYQCDQVMSKSDSEKRITFDELKMELEL